jgi:hypothetical protein
LSRHPIGEHRRVNVEAPTIHSCERAFIIRNRMRDPETLVDQRTLISRALPKPLFKEADGEERGDSMAHPVRR